MTVDDEMPSELQTAYRKMRFRRSWLRPIRPRTRRFIEEGERKGLLNRLRAKGLLGDDERDPGATEAWHETNTEYQRLAQGYAEEVLFSGVGFARNSFRRAKINLANIKLPFIEVVEFLETKGVKSELEPIDLQVAASYRRFRSADHVKASWTPKMQYQCIAWAKSLFHGPNPRQKLYSALSYARQLQLMAQNAPQAMEQIFNASRVPPNRGQAIETTRLAKLIVGETVKKMVMAEDKHKIVERHWHWDDKLVHKIAKMLAIFETQGIGPEAIPEWLRANGGMQHCLSKFLP